MRRTREVTIGVVVWLIIVLVGSVCFAAWMPRTERRLMQVTAYCHCSKCCGPNAKGITASGHRVTERSRFCAADRSIPFDTLIDIPGYGNLVPVWDRGGAIKGDKLDVYFPTHKQAKEWGRRWVWVRVHR